MKVVRAAGGWLALGACLAVVSGAGTAAARAPRWSPSTVIDPVSPVYHVSCASPSFCAAVDLGGNVLTFNGRSWSAPIPLDQRYAHFQSVSCPSASFCAAVDGAGNAVTFNGRTWGTLTGLDSGGFLTDVSCPSASFCMAVGVTARAGDAIYVYRSGSWTPTSDSSNGGLQAVSCASASFCVALGSSSETSAISIWNGSGWSAPAIENNLELVDVSCVSASFCTAVDDVYGNVLTYDGASWSAPVTVDRSGNEPNSVSCPSASFCVAVDNGGSAFTYNGVAWTGPTRYSPPAGGASGGVSCTSPSFCVAVLGVGASVFGNFTPPPAVQIPTPHAFASPATGAATIPLVCARWGRCKGTLTLTTLVRRRVHRRVHGHLRPVTVNIQIQVGRATYALPAGTSHSVAVRVSKQALALLRRYPYRLVVTARMTLSGAPTRTARLLLTP